MIGEKEKRITEALCHGRNPVRGKLAIEDCVMVVVKAGDVVPDVVGGKQAGGEEGKKTSC